MGLRKLFDKPQKDKDSGSKYILDRVYLASLIVNNFGSILKQTSKFIWGVSENRLPHSKEEIEEAIKLLLGFYQTEFLWEHFKKSYPELSETLFTNKYYGALRGGYLELSKFINDDDGQLCEKAISESTRKNITEDEIEHFKSLDMQKVSDIQKRIATETHLRLIELQKKYGINDTHPAFERE